MTTASRVATVLRAAGAVATLAVAVVVVAVSWSDSGVFTLLLAGVPAAAATAVLVAAARRTAAVPTTWVAAVVVLAWSVVTGLGAGAYFAAPGLVLLAAAVASAPSGGSRP